MQTRLTAYLAQIDAMSLRARGLIFLTALAVAVYGWHTWLMQPLGREQARLQSRSDALRADLKTFHVKIDEYLNEQRADPDADNHRRLRALRARADSSRSSLEQLMAGLVPPREVPRVLARMLARDAGLTLVKLEGLGPSPIAFGEPESPTPVAPASAGTEQGGVPGGEVVDRLRLYRHGMRITFEGGYIAALQYLSRLEASAWKLIWDAVEMDVTEHPRAIVSITVFSLSTDDAWIGV